MALTLTEVVAQEFKAINERRKLAPPLPKANTTNDTVGLAFSGGGVRSAAVCLGVSQALGVKGLWKRIDYLSTVSGGGYIGAAITATMTKTDGTFVFSQSDDSRSKTAPAKANDKPALSANEISDTPAVGHLRNYSNYLIPKGIGDLFADMAIILRGFAANAMLVLPFLLFFAAITVFANKSSDDLGAPDIFGIPLPFLETAGIFAITKISTLALFILLAAWAIARSKLKAAGKGEFQGIGPKVAQGTIALTIFIFFCELQPFVLKGLFDLSHANAANEAAQSGLSGAFRKWFALPSEAVTSSNVWALIVGWLKALSGALIPVLVAVLTFFKQFTDLVKTSSERPGPLAALITAASKTAIWIVALIVPLILWVSYLQLSYWGVVDSLAVKNGGTHTPGWLLAGANGLANAMRWILGRFEPETWLTLWMQARPVPFLYLIAGCILLFLGWWLTPNANSLHRLYRDRLSKAFLFDPMARETAQPGQPADAPSLSPDFMPLDTFKLRNDGKSRGLSTELAPLHLINAALNIQASAGANRRGRNAEFFTFSPLHVGSTVTGYAPTAAMQEAVPELDLATAVAISGAAASSNMGANTLKPLTPTLALLNVRLGYWLRNPGHIGPAKDQTDRKDSSLFYLWSEMRGQLRETDEHIYLTDGGHIENLGVYELLRRKCGLIIAVDAEADPEMNFTALVTLQRLARIDLGVKIDLPWPAIRKTGLYCMGQNAKRDLDETAAPAEHGPHIALGSIDYGNGEKGLLLYIKASLTGDENDYVRNYARRNPQFPHETTGDQFFSEEQFEVYRALGFHMLNRMLKGEDGLAVQGETGLENWNKSTNTDVEKARAFLQPAAQ